MSARPAQHGSAGHQRRTPFSARGEPRVWLMAMSVVLCLALILAMGGLILVRGSATFWPGRIDEITLRDGTRFLGVPRDQEDFEPLPDEQKQIDQAKQAGVAFIPSAFTPTGQPIRRKYLVGNRDLGQATIRWVSLWRVANVDRPEGALLVERQEWGPFLGYAKAHIEIDEAGHENRTELKGGGDARQALKSAMQSMRSRRNAIERLDRGELPKLQNRRRALEWDLRKAQLKRDRAIAGDGHGIGSVVWGAFLAIFVVSALATAWLIRNRRVRTSSAVRATTPCACLLLVIGSGLVVWLESPGHFSAERLERVRASVEARQAEIEAKQDELLARLDELSARDAKHRLILVEPGQGAISAVSQSEPNEPMRMSQVVRIVPANSLSLSGKIGVYLSRWWEYLSTRPREGASAGGVWPVIVGTVTLTILLTISVVPLGVIAALYLREYARQGIVTSIVRIAINNLAGVPSIVFGMFGLGFFCYTLGAYVDAGPSHPMPRMTWWMFVAAMLLIILLAYSLWMWSRERSGQGNVPRARMFRMVSIFAWLIALALAILVLAKSPYFHGFFEEKLPAQTTFGGRGILWASLTLALLTLPVVIVATEEAIAAVPGSMREGSYGCGASKWQTMRRIVLPSAMPGILTGGILAMARGAGEVAPLMLVGAVNLAPALPISTEPPFLHGDRTFMHLGFHIYTLSFQSPDSEATEPLVWTTTLLLLTIVLLLNLVAIVVRGRLRARMRTSAV